MARSRRGPIEWFSPDPRGILPLDAFHVPKSLARRVRSGRYHITRDAVFTRVIQMCAEPRQYEDQTWISASIVRVYSKLHDMGIGHSVEAWLPPPDNAPYEARERNEFHPDKWQLVGGLYGLALGGAYFGESMFSRAADASKVCLVHLVEHLRQRGFVLLDAQVSNQHLEQFGVVEIPREQYLARLNEALMLDVTW